MSGKRTSLLIHEDTWRAMTRKQRREVRRLVGRVHRSAAEYVRRDQVLLFTDPGFEYRPVVGGEAGPTVGSLARLLDFYGEGTT